LVRELDSLSIPGLDPATETVFVSAVGCDVGAFGRPGGTGAGTGCGTAEQARHAAIGETLERYAAGVIPADLFVATIGELDAPHVPLDPHAFAHQPVGTDDPLRWVRGQRLVDGSDCWVPAAMVYFPYVCGETEPQRSMGSSQGLAAGANLQRAVIHATCEGIERDAFMRAWRFDGARLRLPNPYPARPDLHFALVPNRFGLPVVTAFSEAAAVPYCIAGIAGRGSVAEAVEAAAREVIGGRVFFDRRIEQSDRTIEARYRHATDPSLRAARARWLDRPFAELKSDGLAWDEFVVRVPDAVMVDLTPPDVRSLGVFVVRVCIPGCHTFEPRADSPFLGGNRTPIPY
jgi:ribosomal protein S12 methylthiotransferase accessory factor YcaO